MDAGADRLVDRTWEDVRCRECRKLLCKTTIRPLKSGEVVELKCPKCDTLNYLMGRPV